MLSINNLSVSIGKNLILDDISFKISTGDILAVVGPSGCGKSTLLNILSGIIKQYDGEVTLNGTSLHNHSFRCGYVPQTLGLLPWKKVHSNILLPYKIDKSLKINNREVEDIINELDIANLIHRYPSQLSGGQKQRVALARAFLSNPELLLMDEPFSALDNLTSEISRNLFLKIWNKYKTTTILTTHNLNEAATLGKYILIFSQSPAKVMLFIENPFFNMGEEAYNENFHTFVKHLKEMLHNSYPHNSNILNK